jgi:hypothetical protein
VGLFYGNFFFFFFWLVVVVVRMAGHELIPGYYYYYLSFHFDMTRTRLVTEYFERHVQAGEFF